MIQLGYMPLANSLVGHVLISMILVCGLPWHIAVAQVNGEAPDFKTYQNRFAEILKQHGTDSEVGKPIWLQPEIGGGKEGCMTCHQGISDNRFLYARLPYKRHSGHYVEDHPPSQFGCTACHGGVGEGLTFASSGHPRPYDSSRQRQWEQYYGWQPPGAEGMVPLKWITGRCALCHTGSNTPRGTELYQESRNLVAEKQCTACHTFRDEPTEKYVRRSVRLGQLGSKVGHQWLETYLKSPHADRSGTAMPGFRYEGDELQSITDYLLSRTDPDIPWSADNLSTDPAAIERGHQIVLERKCQTCHDIPGINEHGFIQQTKIGPPLARVGEKLNSEWIRKWLANPHEVRPETGMPRFTFKAGEIEDVTAFLASLRSPGAVAATQVSPGLPRTPAQVQQVVGKYNCTACHSVAGLAVDPAPRTDLSRVGPELFARLAQSGKEQNVLEGPGGIFHRNANSPRMFGNDEPDDAILTFLAAQAESSFDTSTQAPNSKQLVGITLEGPAGKLVTAFRCLSCHTIRGVGGDIGPDLTYAGSKLERDWLVRFLQSPQRIRPMNRAQMPQLGLNAKQASTLADWIVAELKAPDVEENPPELDFAFSFVGAAKVKSPFGCVTCHRIGEEGGTVGPDLNHVGSRLTATWIYHWIKNPNRWVPGVRMPRFDINEEDLAAITRYLDEQK